MAARRIAVAPRTARGGFSLIELMVAVTIGLVVTLIIFNVLQASETRKRTTTGVNDINQSGAYSAYILDRTIRTAGSGFSNQLAPSGQPRGIEGCRLSMNRGATVLAPAPSAYPAPFAGVAQTPVIAPVIIDQGANSDVITVMSGASGLGEVGARTSLPTPAIATVGVTSTISLRANDLVLFAREAATGPCVVSQIASLAAPDSVTLGGTYSTGTPASALQEADLALSLGNITTNPPQMRMYGVGAQQTLVSYDLLRLDGSAFADMSPVAEGVVAMRAIYGIDNLPVVGGVAGDNIVDEWVDPSGLNWSGTALRAGTAAASERIRQIVAVRVAIVLRTATAERDPINANRSFTLYSDLPVAFTRPVISFTAAGDDRFRYRVIETTIPVRNNLL